MLVPYAIIPVIHSLSNCLRYQGLGEAEQGPKGLRGEQPVGEIPKNQTTQGLQEEGVEGGEEQYGLYIMITESHII